METLSGKLMELILLNKRELPKSPQNIADLCREVENILLPRLESKQISLRTNVQPSTFIVEPDLFKVLLTNLIDNAIKASAEGSNIQLNSYSEGDEGLVIEVLDQGIGIAEEDISKVFEPFFMADKSRTRTLHGAGLGLALCEEIVKLHGGKISISSQLHVGTKVQLIFP